MAIIRLPAQVPVNDPRYGGPILINPGGPGASGIDTVESGGKILQTVVDAAYFNGSADYVSQRSGAKYFDIIGFDPRGVGESEEPIQYMGFSYGTVLGTTLAAMQPHRVKRLRLDGVSSSPEYYSGELTLDSADGDVAMERFFDFCAAAGPNACALWAGNTSADTRHRLRSILLDLEQNGSIPVPVDSRTGEMKVVSLGNVRMLLNSALYKPLRDWPDAAEYLAPLTYRNGTLMPILNVGGPGHDQDLPAAFDQDDPSTASGSIFEELNLGLINGGDSSLRFKTEKGFADHTSASLRGATEWIGDSESTTWMVDTLWPINFDWRFGDKNVRLVSVLARHGGTTSKQEMPDTSKHCLPAMGPFELRRQTEVHGHLTKEDHVLFKAQKSLAGVFWE
ncbi:hypothetical protein M409DRAFT_54483 [Zasmidium cellare ATCC 36951]|uniref:Uncharacterized protein n=1 Tax=Zasmidium cellare ATCC 36951 TaxID=1080233 RepID=A0A6A6CJB0_ZASCE|nr:uncharacterized protein M409DRAFT_54483 [Zasmidium cellare ATCC 36951]KAF2167317.1 hypothetical protein M409DRAFT_54483 [Zasmidium cellare ATCC 36951]